MTPVLVFLLLNVHGLHFFFESRSLHRILDSVIVSQNRICRDYGWVHLGTLTL